MNAMLRKEERSGVSPYQPLYDLLVPADHILRRIKEMVDFSFVYEELRKNYTPDFGRNAADPVYLFKLLLLKVMYPLSDRDLCERARFDLSFKFFLDLAPEDGIVHPSLLSKFRTQRLKDVELLELLIRKSLEVAEAQGVPLGDTLIVDATHTHARFQYLTPLEALRKQSAQLRKACYQADEGVKSAFPAKNTVEDMAAEIAYTKELLLVIEGMDSLRLLPAVREKANLTQEMVDDQEAHLSLATSPDPDAQIGHKTADTSFFGFKSHIAMTDQGLITGLVVTSGEKPDGPYLPDLVAQSERNGLKIKRIIGDTAYSSKENLELCAGKEPPIPLIAKLHPIVSKGGRRSEDSFYFNKDAGMMVCPEGHMAVRKARTGMKNTARNQRLTYYFDVEKCHSCPLEGTCHTMGGKSKTYSVSLKSELQQEQMAFEETEAFKAKARLRYRIEQKNSELKNRYGLKRAMGNGLFGMTIQGASTVFMANLRRIERIRKG